MLDILIIAHSFSDVQTASRIRRTCRRLSALIPCPRLYIEANCITKYEYRVGNKLHKLDGPAIEYMGKHLYWYRGGIGHREYHPQYISDCCKSYRVDGVLHREIGPSILEQNKATWYLRGKIHRKSGPSIVNTWTGTWYTLGEMHRLDGPATSGEYIIRGKYHRISSCMYGIWLVNDVCIREYGL